MKVYVVMIGGNGDASMADTTSSNLVLYSRFESELGYHGCGNTQYMLLLSAK